MTLHLLQEISATNDGIMHWIFSTLIAALTGERVWTHYRTRSIMRRRTFADDPAEYWKQMELRVTNPLKAVLEKQTDIMEEQVKGNTTVMLALAKMEGRTER